MSVEIELRKLLQNNGYVTKKTKKGSAWTLENPNQSCSTINYHNNDTVSFNYLGKFMRDAVKKTYKTHIGIDPTEKKRLYHNALSNLSFYEHIKNALDFSLRAKGGDYVSISHDVGMNTFREIVKFIVSESGEEIIQSIASRSIGEKDETRLPTKEDILIANEQLLQKGNTAPTIAETLNFVEKIFNKKGIPLQPNWRIITEENVRRFWFN